MSEAGNAIKSLLPPAIYREGNIGKIALAIGRVLDEVTAALFRAIAENYPITSTDTIAEWRSVYDDNRNSESTPQLLQSYDVDVGGQAITHIIQQLQIAFETISILERLTNAARCGDGQSRCGAIRCGGESYIAITYPASTNDLTKKKIQDSIDYYFPAHIDYLIIET